MSNAIQAELKRWAPIVKASGAKIDCMTNPHRPK